MNSYFPKALKIEPYLGFLKYKIRKYSGHMFLYPWKEFYAFVEVVPMSLRPNLFIHEL